MHYDTDVAAVSALILSYVIMNLTRKKDNVFHIIGIQYFLQNKNNAMVSSADTIVDAITHYVITHYVIYVFLSAFCFYQKGKLLKYVVTTRLFDVPIVQHHCGT